MAHKWLSVREFDLNRQLDPNDPRAANVDGKAMLLAQDQHQRKNGTPAILTRLRAGFNARRDQVRRSRAEREHDRPGQEHPRRGENPASESASEQWKVFLASEDFVAFICYSLRLTLSDADSGLALARWRASLARLDTNGISIASMVRDCMAAARDEWQQDLRNGGKEADDETREAIELLTEIEAQIVQVDSTNVDSLAI